MFVWVKSSICFKTIDGIEVETIEIDIHQFHITENIKLSLCLKTVDGIDILIDNLHIIELESIEIYTHQFHVTEDFRAQNFSENLLFISLVFN